MLLTANPLVAPESLQNKIQAYFSRIMDSTIGPNLLLELCFLREPYPVVTLGTSEVAQALLAHVASLAGKTLLKPCLSFSGYSKSPPSGNGVYSSVLKRGGRANILFLMNGSTLFTQLGINFLLYSHNTRRKPVSTALLCPWNPVGHDLIYLPPVLTLADGNKEFSEKLGVIHSFPLLAAPTASQ